VRPPIDLRQLVAAVEADPQLARALARILAPHVLGAACGAFERAAKPASYSTRAGEALPGYPRDEWRRVARAIGTKRGRWWVVTVEVLEEHERRVSLGAVHSDTPANDAGPEWSPSAALASVDLPRSR
jgi:hypothetical protein